jgi:serine/threonine protein kinase
MTTELVSTGRQSHQAKAFVSEIIARHASDVVLDAKLILNENPSLEQFPSVVVDLAYEEFCRRVDAGESIEPGEFAGRFPAVTAPLLKLLEVHAFLDQHPDAFGGGPEAVWPEAGTEVAGFRLEREIGRGGFSRVFLAREKDLGDRQVVLKICIRANEEAARLGQLDHPHIVPVHSVQFDSYPPFTLICMPFLGATTLGDLLDQVFADGCTQPTSSGWTKALERLYQPTNDTDSNQSHESGRRVPTRSRGTYADYVLRKGAELCDALHYAHRWKIWHCDVKPSNVLLARDGRALLLDFNLAMQQEHRAGVVGGTLPYMAPEQLQYVVGDDEPTAAVDQRTDLFSLGATMFQLLTGRLPFPTENLAQNRNEAGRQLLELQRAGSDWSRELDGLVSPNVARTIAACLAFDPQDRPDSAAEVAREFRRGISVGVRVRRWVRRQRWALSLAAMVLLVFASVFGVAMSYRAPAHLHQFETGIAALDKGDFARANRCFDNARNICPDFREALLLRGWSDLLAARSEERNEAARAELMRSAREDFRQAWDQYGCAESAASLAQWFAETEDHLEARRFFENALEQGFISAGAANNMGYGSRRLGDFQMGLEYLTKAIQLDPSLETAHRNLLELRRNLAQRAKNKNEDSQAKEHLQMAFDQIRLMRQFAPPSAELELMAARVFALPIQFGWSDSEAQGEDWQIDLLEELLASCETATYLELAPERLQEMHLLVPELKDDERLQRLLKETPRPAMASVPNVLVDIFPEIRARLTVICPEN